VKGFIYFFAKSIISALLKQRYYFLNMAFLYGNSFVSPAIIYAASSFRQRFIPPLIRQILREIELTPEEYIQYLKEI
jgi:hypothetical protein